MRLMAIAVPRAAAAVLTRLLLSSTVARSLSGRCTSRETNLAVELPLLARFVRWARDKAIKAVSEEEKKADRIKHTMKRANFDKSEDSISKFPDTSRSQAPLASHEHECI